MKHDVLLLGAARERAEVERIEIDLAPDATIAQVRAALAEALPQIAEFLPSCAIALDHRYRRDEETLGEGPVEIALVPPVSGG